MFVEILKLFNIKYCSTFETFADFVEMFDDSDGTVCDALRKIRPCYFANGGDRGKENTPEQDVCEELGIEMLWGVGGDYKRNSSSDLAKNLVENYPKSK